MKPELGPVSSGAARQGVSAGAGEHDRREQGRRRAAVLVILASALWLHAWLPALLVLAFVGWTLLHKRLEADLGEEVRRRWQRVWPPAALVLIAVIVGGSVAFWFADEPMTTKVLPIALNLLALSMLVIGSWRWSFGQSTASA